MPVKTYTIFSINSSNDLHPIDSLKAHDENLIDSEGFEFRRLINVYPPYSRTELFCLSDAYNNNLRNQYLQVVDDLKNHDNCGILIFKDVRTLGRESLIVDEARSRVYIGHIINWSREYFNWWIENSNVGFVRWLGDHSFLADFGIAMLGRDRGILMNAPGHDIYGHWLIDFLPRMALSKLIRKDVDATHLFGPLKDWMRDLIARSGLYEFESLNASFEKYGELIVPTATKFGYGFFEPLNALSWRRLALSLNHDNVDSTLPTAERIFVSRRHWPGGRAIDYHEELESVMARLGFTVVHPQSISLHEQARMFSRAKVVVGEDGSALHNVIFSAPGARLGVLMHTDRTNLWHAGICHLLGHQIAYAPLPSAAEAITNGLHTISSFVSRLLTLDQNHQEPRLAS